MPHVEDLCNDEIFYGKYKNRVTDFSTWDDCCLEKYCLELYGFIILRAIQTYIKEKYTEYVVNISKIDSTKCYHPFRYCNIMFFVRLLFFV